MPFPDSLAGEQLSWFLDAVRDATLTEETLDHRRSAEFRHGFLGVAPRSGAAAAVLVNVETGDTGPVTYELVRTALGVD